MADALEFVRRIDGLVYRFERAGSRHGRPCYRRVDLDLWCLWLPSRGWCTVDADGNANSWPLLPADRPEPVLGAWRSWKAGRSYLYDLRAAPAGSDVALQN